MIYLRHKFNYCLNRHFVKKYKPAKHKKLDENRLSLFKEKGEGLYNIYFERNVNSSSPFFYAFVTKIIYWVSGKYTHGATVLYAEDIKKYFTQKDYNKLIKKYEFFYGVGFYNACLYLKETKVLVLASADETGMNYFDYSFYQDRSQVITKPIINKPILDNIKIIVSLYMSDKIYNSVYDFFGLFFWTINRKIYDYFSFYCSELIYFVFKKIGINVADNPHPSPSEEVIYAEKNNIIVEKL